MATTMKRCPGYLPDGIVAHDLPADTTGFNSNKGSPDGLSVRCRVCGNLYGKAWAARKRAITAAEAMEPGPERVAAITAATELPPSREWNARHKASTDPADEQRVAPMRLVVDNATPKPVEVYADELAVKARRGKVPGWQAELHGTCWYAVPAEAATIETEQGQAHLAAVAAAVVAERRAKDAERKRTERAAKKAAAQAQA